MHRVSTNNYDIDKPQNKYGPRSKNLASIIRGFKSAVTVKSCKIIFDFAWQPLFHDHIILDDNEYQLIKIYITENPLMWNEDKHFVD